MKLRGSLRYFLIAGLVTLIISSGHINKGYNSDDRSSGKVRVIQADPLPSWNDGSSKRSIIEFVKTVTKTGSPFYIEVKDRIAVFDNDGTLWAEQPLYFQFQFVIDRVKTMAPQHPEWKDKEPFKSILAGDAKKALSGGEKGMMEIMMVTLVHSHISRLAYHHIISLSYYLTA